MPPGGGCGILTMSNSRLISGVRWRCRTVASPKNLSTADRGRVGHPGPQWTFGMATYAFAGADRIVCAYSRNRVEQLGVLDLNTEGLRRLESWSGCYVG